MRRSMSGKASKWSLAYSVLFFLLCASYSVIGQEISKTYTKEIEVPAGTSIATKGPRNFYYEMEGKITTRTVNNEFVIVPGKNNNIPALVVKNYQVFTTDDNKVTQTVEIHLIPDERYPNEANQLFEQLEIKLELNPAGDLIVDDNMNLSGFAFNNGMFRKNVNTFTLEGGKKFRVRGLVIKSKLSIPQSSNLEIASEVINTQIGDLDGKLTLNVASGILTCGHLNELEASLRFCNATFRNIKSAQVNGQNSIFKADKIDRLIIGGNRKTSVGSLLLNSSTSALSEFNISEVGFMEILNTASDKFRIGKLTRLKSLSSTFSDYDIDELTHSMDLNARNGDIKIGRVLDGFESISINNHISTIWMDLNDVDDYTITLSSDGSCEYQFPGYNSAAKGIDAHRNSWLYGDKSKAGKINLRCDSCKITIEGKE